MISDGDLLLYYYRDGLDAAERERIAAALSEQPELAARLHRLIARLDAAATTPEVPVPAHLQQRWHAALSRVSPRDTVITAQPRSDGFGRFRWPLAAAAVAGVLVILSVKVLLQSMQSVTPQSGAQMQATLAGAIDASAYQRGLQLHLANTEVQLASLNTVSDEERSQLIETIIAQNRLYAIAAERADEPQLARVLRAFTPILERVADERSDEAAGELAQLNFELQVMQARLNTATSNRSTTQSTAL